MAAAATAGTCAAMFVRTIMVMLPGARTGRRGCRLLATAWRQESSVPDGMPQSRWASR